MRTPTEQGRQYLDGPIEKGSQEEIDACVRRVKLESRDQAEAVMFLRQLGLIDQDFEWVATSRNRRKRVPK
ncbi:MULTISPECIES: hypothetical protein [Actinomycetes]|uniref:hypothetical protein n=1 Tax=Actinomycetes TaxID=1760 RepID=UPI001319C7F3|nr:MULTISPECIES: hypothetical protein [Actinomycetes]